MSQTPAVVESDSALPYVSGAIRMQSTGTPPWVLISSLWLLALFPSNAAPASLATAAAGGVCAVVAWSLIVQRRAHLTLGAWAIALAFVAVSAGTAKSGAQSSDLLPVLKVGMPLILLAVAAGQVRPDSRTSVFKSLVILATVEAALSIGQKLSGVWPIWGWLGQTSTATYGGDNALWGPTGRAAGTMGHGIPLAMLLVVGLLITVTIRLGWPAPVRLAVTIVLLAGVAATGSRSAVIVGAAALAIAIFTQSGPVGTTTVRILTGWVVVTSLLVVDYRSLTLVDSLDGSFSLTHRQGSWESFSRLLGQPLVDNLIGNGWNSVPRLAQRGYFDVSVTSAVDNNFVSLYAIGGMMALIGVAVLTGWGFVRGDATTRVCLLVVGGMFFSFDVVFWPFAMAILVIMACLTPMSLNPCGSAPPPVPGPGPTPQHVRLSPRRRPF